MENDFCYSKIVIGSKIARFAGSELILYKYNRSIYHLSDILKIFSYGNGRGARVRVIPSTPNTQSMPNTIRIPYHVS